MFRLQLSSVKALTVLVLHEDCLGSNLPKYTQDQELLFIFPLEWLQNTCTKTQNVNIDLTVVNIYWLLEPEEEATLGGIWPNDVLTGLLTGFLLRESS